jgi:hypothetical protein
MVINENQFAAQVQSVVDQLGALGEGLANDGLIGASGVVLAAKQTIRLLWTRLHPPLRLVSDPPPEAPAEDVPTPGPESVPPVPEVPKRDPTEEMPAPPAAPPLEAAG